jgi:hypothetical protein
MEVILESLLKALIPTIIGFVAYIILQQIFYWFKFRNIYLEEQEKKFYQNKLSVGALFFAIWIACWVAVQ